MFGDVGSVASAARHFGDSVGCRCTTLPLTLYIHVFCLSI